MGEDKETIKLRKKARKDWILLCGIEACYWLTMTLHSSFLVFYLKQNQYDTTLIAAITLGMTITNLFAQPVWGYIADAFCGIKKVLLICLAGSIPGLLLLPVVVKIVWITVLLNIVYAVFNYPIQGLTDSITNIAATRNKFVEFGFTRGCGSIASSIGSLGIGFILNSTDTAALFKIEAALLFAGALLLLSFKNIKYGIEDKNQNFVAAAANVKESVLHLIKDPVYIVTLLSITLMNTGNRASCFFTPILIEEYGGNNIDLGISLFLNCLLMMPCMIIHTKLLKKGVRNHWPLMFGAIMNVFRVGALYFAHTLPVLVGLQIIQSFAYGFLQPSTIAAASEASPIEIRSTAISMAVAVTTVFSTFIGQIGASYVSDFIGIHNTFLLSAFLVIIGIVIYFPIIIANKTKSL